MGFLFFIVVLAGWLYLYSRLRSAEDRLNQEQYERNRDAETIAALTRRVFALERSQSPLEPASTRPVVPPTFELPAPVPLPPPALIDSPPVSPPLREPAPRIEVLEPVLTVPAAFRESAATQRTWRDQLRESMGGQEWEAVVGGNWLNKLGVLVLVIGIALLLGYEFTHVGPAGRVATGMAVGVVMLIGGVLIERKPGYAIFARGLIGGGWAAIYFTTYATHALAAAKIIDNPYLATALLLAAACGMILHSLRYRSQTVSGLAYFTAFATLALSESTPFSVLALLPLAASLLYLAYRFQWHQMAVFGLFATYATCASRSDVGAPLASTQALFASYWLLFETFDLLRLRRGTADATQNWSIDSFILPGNAAGFLCLSIVKWQRTAPQHLYAFLACCAAVYLASALLRTRLRPPSGFDQCSSTLDRVAAGGYEGPLTISAGLATAAILLRATGQWVNISLLIEGEILFLAGWYFGQTYLRQLAGVVFAGSLAKTALADPVAGGSVALAGHAWNVWSPVALLSAAVFYVNRLLRSSEGMLYSTAAAGLVAIVLDYETPKEYLCVAWLAFAAVSFEVGIRCRQCDLRFHAYIVGALGTGAGLVLNSLGLFGGQSDWPLAWLPLAVCAALYYGATLRISLDKDEDRLADWESNVAWITAACAALFLFVIAWKLAPQAYLGMAWLLLGAVLFELGLHGLPKHFRWLSYFVSALGFWNLFWNHVVEAQIGSAPAEAISLAAATAVCWAVSARVFRPLPDRIGDWEREWCRDLYAGAGALFVMTLAWLKLPPPAVSLVWTVLGVAIFQIGLRFAAMRCRWLAHLVAAVVCIRLFTFDLAGFGDAFHITHRTFTIFPIVAAHYYLWWRGERSLSRLYLYTATLVFIALARFELGSTLVVAGFALFGLAIFEIGQLRKIGDLRWQSYALGLLSFSYTVWMLAENRSGVLPAALVIATLYCAQLLARRELAGNIERYARAFYSLLATLLLAILLFYRVSGGTLTMVWAVQALALLGAGFPLRDRALRISGLALFMICVFKLFLYDLRELETVNRILSFIVLGLILVGVSWIYTRFHGRIQRYL